MRKQIVNKGVTILSFAVLWGAASFAVAANSKPEIPEYLGSKVCLACHTEEYVAWKSSDHANMLLKITNDTELPLAISHAPGELRPVLREAEYFLAGTFFIARDSETQHYKLLDVVYDKASNSYKPSNIILDWSTNCSGCHVTNINTPNLTWGEDGIGCEACHGPGRDHVLSKGDPSKIVSSKESDICGQCHGGNDGTTGGHLMSDGTKWIVGYRPGMKLSQIEGLQLTSVDPDKVPPDAAVTSTHLRNYNMWEASKHARALSKIIDNDTAKTECYACHSAEGFQAKLQGKTIDISGKAGFNTLTCTACHNAHNSDYPHQLVVDSRRLCNSCHTQVAFLKGEGVSGVDETPGVHSEVACVTCHMTEANHLMKVIRPDASGLAESRTDSCTACHSYFERKYNAELLQSWESKFSKEMETLQEDLNYIRNAAKTDEAILTGELKSKFDSAGANIMLLVRDGSHGVHNFELTTNIMSKVREDLDTVKAVIK